VNHYAAPDFWARYQLLPATVREAADGAFALLKTDPRHPSLHFKRVGEFWSARVGRHHRAVGRPVSGAVLWFWIGTHAEYDRRIG